jgi:succinyl-diaminopimelate desuccinylase
MPRPHLLSPPGEARNQRTMPASDPLPLARALLACASVTPADGGAQTVLTAALEKLGFSVHHLRYGITENLFARIGTGAPHICFAGHTDVVPPGLAWEHPPFAAELDQEVLYGRGACDMKGAIAAFVAAVETHLAAGHRQGSISLLITGDEEGPATDGTIRVLEWMDANGQIPDMCIVGEPTNPMSLGDMIKIGRRGSLNAHVTIHGTQGHVGYPHRADNPVHRLVTALADLTATRLDSGNDWFEPSSLQITSVDVGNDVSNIIPANATARLNIRFNDLQTGAGLHAWLRDIFAHHTEKFDLSVTISGEAFLTKPGDFTQAVATAVESVTGRTPKLDTAGGTSDARFIARYCPVAEFGLVGASMHKTDENVPIADLRQLAAIYANLLHRVLA